MVQSKPETRALNLAEFKNYALTHDQKKKKKKKELIG